MIEIKMHQFSGVQNLVENKLPVDYHISMYIYNMHQFIRRVHVIDLCSHCKKDHFSMTIETTFFQGFVNVDASLACTRPQCTVVSGFHSTARKKKHPTLFRKNEMDLIVVS